MDDAAKDKGRDVLGRNGIPPNLEIPKDFVLDLNGDSKDGNCLGIGYENIGSDDEGDALGHGRAEYGTVVARMPAHKTATHYNMNHKNRGKAIIFNHEVFEISTLKSRSGTDQDSKNLEMVLKNLGFDVEVYQDLKYHEIEGVVKRVSSMDHMNNDCVLIAILSHGDTGVLYAKDTPYKPENLLNRFTADRCPTLAGKPKMFFFQACQGDKLDGGVTLFSRTETDGQSLVSYRIPTQADFLVVYSTAKGYFAWRNTSRGSWFIQALCEELKNRALENDLLTILTFVSQRVATDYESNVPDSPTMHQQKQIPCVMSMLTRLIQFNNTS